MSRGGLGGVPLLNIPLDRPSLLDIRPLASRALSFLPDQKPAAKTGLSVAELADEADVDAVVPGKDFVVKTVPVIDSQG